MTTAMTKMVMMTMTVTTSVLSVSGPAGVGSAVVGLGGRVADRFP